MPTAPGCLDVDGRDYGYRRCKQSGVVCALISYIS
uniref:Uncharacterized protein n=1 Tax=Moniliophthora roreri TaxID=221103 RepID=A0A0W0FNC6_MONRR